MNPHAKKSGVNPDQREKVTPPPPSFDTLRAVERLKNAEFGEKQAVTLVETLQDVQNELATRADLEKTEFALRNDVEKAELALRGDMEKMELGLRRDMEKMESGIRSDMKKMESGIRADMGEMKFDLRSNMDAKFQKLQWFLLLAIGGATGIISTLTVLVSDK